MARVLRPPEDERWRRLEHAIVLAVVAGGAWRAWSVASRLGVSGMYQAVAEFALAAARAVPGVGGAIAEEEAKTIRDIERDVHGTGDPRAFVVVTHSCMPNFGAADRERRC